MSSPAWIRCVNCEDWWCSIHQVHVADCACPGLIEWERWGMNPYCDPGPCPATQHDITCDLDEDCNCERKDQTMTQIDLFAGEPAPPTKQQLVALQVVEQEREQARVTEKLSAGILEFHRRRLAGRATDRFFHLVDLEEFLRKVRCLAFASDSPRRIQALLRKEGQLNYRLVSKPDSLYEALPIEVRHD